MADSSSTEVLIRFLAPLGQSLSVELARALLVLRADDELQRRYEKLAERNTAGALGLGERAELGMPV